MLYGMCVPRLFDIRDTFSCVRMDLRIHRIRKEEYHQHRTDDHKFLFIKPVYQIIYHRSDHVYDGQTANTEYKKPFCADPAVQVQEISAVIPPFRAACGNLQIGRASCRERV